MSTNFCTECGSQLLKGMKFCPQCGQKILSLKEDITSHNQTSFNATAQPVTWTVSTFSEAPIQKEDANKSDIHPEPSLATNDVETCQKEIKTADGVKSENNLPNNSSVDTTRQCIERTKKRSFIVAYLLLFTLGSFGAHRVYLRQGYTVRWILILLILCGWLMGKAVYIFILSWLIIDFFLIPSMLREANYGLTKKASYSKWGILCFLTIVVATSFCISIYHLYTPDQTKYIPNYNRSSSNEKHYKVSPNDYQTTTMQEKSATQNNLNVGDTKRRAVKQSDKETAKYYRKVADQGNADAQYALGIMYMEGRGVEQSYETAAKYFHKSALQGRADAQYQIALMYLNGEGVKHSSIKAKLWLRKAAEQGHKEAQDLSTEIQEYDWFE